MKKHVSFSNPTQDNAIRRMQMEIANDKIRDAFMTLYRNCKGREFKPCDGCPLCVNGRCRMRNRFGQPRLPFEWKPFGGKK